jgi:alpha-mannosidase
MPAPLRRISVPVDADQAGKDQLIAEATGARTAAPEDGLDIARAMTIHVIPQAHIDLLWYWGLDEAREMVLDTFRSHIELLEADPSLTYAQSQAYAYDLVRAEAPPLFERLRKLVSRGQWEIVGGEWVESETSIPGPEARLRQFLAGQQFFMDHFGARAKVGWCPDGFTLQGDFMPQVLRQAGIDAYVHKRPRQRHAALPPVPYRWRGLDGSEVLACRCNNKGNGLPRLSEGVAAPAHKGDLAIIAEQFQRAGIDHLWGPMGIGDTGGANKYVLPSVSAWFTARYSTPGAFFQSVRSSVSPSDLPLHQGTIHGEFAGCLTTWANVKSLNRLAENSLQQAEFAIALGRLLGIAAGADDLGPAWRRLLLLQFHDSLAGCGTREIQQAVEHELQEVVHIAESLRDRQARRIASQIGFRQQEGMPLVVFNPLGCDFSGPVEAQLILSPAVAAAMPPSPPGGQVAWSDATSAADVKLFAVDDDGNESPVMIRRWRWVQKRCQAEIRFDVRNAPAMGYKTIYVKSMQKHAPSPVSNDGLLFKAGKMTVEFDPAGGIRMIHVKGHDPVIAPPGRPLGMPVLHKTGKYDINYGQELRAWETGFTGDQRPLTASACSVNRCSGGRFLVAFDYAIDAGSVRQEFLIEPDSDAIFAQVTGDWRQVEAYLKLHFQPQCNDTGFADQAYGFTSDLPRDNEHPMMYFAGLHNGKTGMLLTNNGRHGCMLSGGVLSLSIIRCASWPEAISDSGSFEINYSISIFDSAAPSWPAQCFRRAWAFNIRPFVCSPSGEGNSLPPARSLLQGAAGPATCLKPAHKGDGVVLRLFNPSPSGGEFVAPSIPGWRLCACDGFLEVPTGDDLPPGRRITLDPWRIVTLLWTRATDCPRTGR